MGYGLRASFFFLTSKNFIYTNGYSMQEKHRANLDKTRRKTERKQERTRKQKKITKEKEN